MISIPRITIRYVTNLPPEKITSVSTKAEYRRSSIGNQMVTSELGNNFICAFCQNSNNFSMPRGEGNY